MGQGKLRRMVAFRLVEVQKMPDCPHGGEKNAAKPISLNFKRPFIGRLRPLVRRPDRSNVMARELGAPVTIRGACVSSATHFEAEPLF